ncbi:MAG: hypothetical protein SPD91_02510 [Streptococcus hyointestinalis]|uniref:hypothetical protein n=1 Tax=Streptococcus hyointestinalis TaxID=1337 RepID=UPI0023F03A04|nr:hypothetical protein [Streptococcus hyointestinalis]MCI6872030.1 hypothetical protein [Streptococcus hyointestinalis]MDD7356472.1 hypothetical protein [Streptococcus hyointestinalis]MDY4553327.1 hypothetical protein [Streptococcus hyointestinalis]
MKRLHTLRLLRFVTGQLPVLALFVLLLCGGLAGGTLAVQALVVLLAVSAAFCNWYFAREIKQEEEREQTAPNLMLTQVSYSIALALLGSACIARALLASQTYQQVIAFICAAICFLLTAGLLWGCYIIKNILRLVVRKSPTGESTHYFFHSQDDKVEVSC